MEKLRVLVAEDDRITQELYNSFLAEEIFERYFAETGEVALDAYRTWQPEVIILDLMLPVVSGYSVLKEIREKFGDKKTPILISSRLSAKDDILSCAKFGVQGYLAKPINWKEIGLKVLDYFQKANPHSVDRLAELRNKLDEKEKNYSVKGAVQTETITVDALKPGIPLARDLSPSDGRPPLSNGLQADSTHPRNLKTSGIDAVEIEGLPDDSHPFTTEEAKPATFNTAEEFLQWRFSQTDVSHPFFAQLFRICVQRRAQQLPIQTPSGNNQITAGLERLPGVRTKSPSPVREKNLAEVLEGIVSLVSLPPIVSEIDRVINDPRSSTIDVADAISKDPNVTMKLLKIVNSAFYNFSSKIDTISRAVAILGSEELRTLASGTSVLETFKDIPPDLADMKSFWKHSIACGTAARIIASHMNIADTERLFVAGLLHDIGRVVIYNHFPQQGRETFLRAKRNNSLLRTVELELLGFDHSQIGAALIQKWKLPATLEQAVRYHHQPTLCQPPLEASIVHIADILANALKIGTSGERLVPPMNPEVWTTLRLPTSILNESVQIIDQQVTEIITLFLGEIDGT